MLKNTSNACSKSALQTMVFVLERALVAQTITAVDPGVVAKAMPVYKAVTQVPRVRPGLMGVLTIVTTRWAPKRYNSWMASYLVHKRNAQVQAHRLMSISCVSEVLVQLNMVLGLKCWMDAREPKHTQNKT